MTFRKVFVRHARVCMTKISNEFSSKLIKFPFFHTNVCNFQENSDNNNVENIFLRVVFIAKRHEVNVANKLPCELAQLDVEFNLIRIPTIVFINSFSNA